MSGIFSRNCDFHAILGSFTCRKLRHGTDGFTFPPKEGVLRIFSPLKFDGFGRVWTRELEQRPARLPLDHRSRYISRNVKKIPRFLYYPEPSIECVTHNNVFWGNQTIPTWCKMGVRAQELKLHRSSPENAVHTYNIPRASRSLQNVAKSERDWQTTDWIREMRATVQFRNI